MHLPIDFASTQTSSISKCEHNSSFFMRVPKWRRNLSWTSLWSCQFYVVMCLEWHLRSFRPFSFICCLIISISLHAHIEDNEHLKCVWGGGGGLEKSILCFLCFLFFFCFHCFLFLLFVLLFFFCILFQFFHFYLFFCLYLVVLCSVCLSIFCFSFVSVCCFLFPVLLYLFCFVVLLFLLFLYTENNKIIKFYNCCYLMFFLLNLGTFSCFS